MFHHIKYSLEDTLSDVRMDEDGEMRVIGIEATLVLRMNIYEEEETEILRDMYSLEEECTFERRIRYLKNF